MRCLLCRDCCARGANGAARSRAQARATLCRKSLLRAPLNLLNNTFAFHSANFQTRLGLVPRDDPEKP